MLHGLVMSDGLRSWSSACAISGRGAFLGKVVPTRSEIATLVILLLLIILIKLAQQRGYLPQGSP